MYELYYKALCVSNRRHESLNSSDLCAVLLQIYFKSEDSSGGQFASSSNESWVQLIYTEYIWKLLF